MLNWLQIRSIHGVQSVDRAGTSGCLHPGPWPDLNFKSVALESRAALIQVDGYYRLGRYSASSMIIAGEGLLHRLFWRVCGNRPLRALEPNRLSRLRFGTFLSTCEYLFLGMGIHETTPWKLHFAGRKLLWSCFNFQILILGRDTCRLRESATEGPFFQSWATTMLQPAQALEESRTQAVQPSEYITAADFCLLQPPAGPYTIWFAPASYLTLSFDTPPLGIGTSWQLSSRLYKSPEPFLAFLGGPCWLAKWYRSRKKVREWANK